MVEIRIEADVIYQHEKYGEVLVTGIAKMYSEWDVTGPQEDIESGNVLIFFYDNYDGYGGMNPAPLSEPVGEFAKSVTRERTHEYLPNREESR
jgi:hypothetical protein